MSRQTRIVTALFASVILSGCSAAGTAALTVGVEIVTKGFDLDTAVIENIRARRDLKTPAASTPSQEGAR